MSLVAGTRLGPYEIQAAVGAGGPASARVSRRASFGEVSPKPSEGRDEGR